MSKYNTNHYYSIDYLSDISCNRIRESYKTECFGQ